MLYLQSEPRKTHLVQPRQSRRLKRRRACLSHWERCRSVHLSCMEPSWGAQMTGEMLLLPLHRPGERENERQVCCGSPPVSSLTVMMRRRMHLWGLEMLRADSQRHVWTQRSIKPGFYRQEPIFFIACVTSITSLLLVEFLKKTTTRNAMVWEYDFFFVCFLDELLSYDARSIFCSISHSPILKGTAHHVTLRLLLPV